MTQTSYAISRVTIDAVTWTAIFPAYDCTKIILTRLDADGFIVGTNPLDLNTQKPVASGWAHTIEANTGTGVTAFSPLVPICYVRATTFGGALVIESVR